MKKTVSFLCLALLVVALCLSVSSCDKDYEVICPCSCCCGSQGSESGSDNGSDSENDSENDSDKADPTKGSFSISSTRKIEFTKANLYWDGVDFHFETNQTDYPKTWSSTHVGHFFWKSTEDYQSAISKYKPYSEQCWYLNLNEDDKFFCGEENPLTVDGVSGCFALCKAEWDYLISKRANATRLYKCGVTVGDKKNCLIIAPDNFVGTLESSYTLEELDALGLVCLPATGFRYASKIEDIERWGGYWTSTPTANIVGDADHLEFTPNFVRTYDVIRSTGLSLRLVRVPQ